MQPGRRGMPTMPASVGPAAAPGCCLRPAKGTSRGTPSFRLHGVGAAEALLEVSMSRRYIPTLKPTQCIAAQDRAEEVPVALPCPECPSVGTKWL